MSMLGDVDERILALSALAEVGDPNALVFFSTEFNDEHAPLLYVLRRRLHWRLAAMEPFWN